MSTTGSVSSLGVIALLLLTGCRDRELPTAVAPAGAHLGVVAAPTCEVTSIADDGPGTLRARMADDGCAILRFAGALHGQTIVLTSGDLIIARDLTIAGPGAAKLALDAAGVSRVISVAPGSAATLEGLTITGGMSEIGGGVLIQNASLTLINSVITKNEASQGGGIYNEGGTVTLSGSTVSENVAFNDGGISNDSQGFLSITLSTISGNSVGDGGSGGIGNRGVLELAHSTVRDNEAQIAGGISTGGPNAHATITNSFILFNRAEIADGGISNGGRLTIVDSEIRGNSAMETGGIGNAGILEIIRSTIRRNVAGDFGGAGIRNHDHGVLTITHSAIFSNEAFDIDGGGGILNEGVVEIFNTTVAYNIAREGPGGAVANRGSHGTVTIIASTLAFNDSDRGGSGIHSSSPRPVTLRNTIVSGPYDGRENCHGSMFDGGFNMENGASCGFRAANQSRSNINPLLDDETLFTPTIALLAGSPAIDAIPLGFGGCGVTLTTDQRGISRPQGAGCDIGAFEREQEPTHDPALAITLSPHYSVNLVGAPVTIMGTVRRNGRPVAGVSVLLTDVSDGSHEGGTTNADGRFSFTFARASPGHRTFQLRIGTAAEVQALLVVEFVSSVPRTCNGFCFLPSGLVEWRAGVSGPPTNPLGQFDALTSTAPFDPALNVTLLICELEGATCGEYKAGFLSTIGANRVRLHSEGQFYWVEFDASAYGLDAAKLYQIRALSNGRLLGSHSATLPGSGLVQIRFRIERR